jgi:hypothetical protein
MAEWVTNRKVVPIQGFWRSKRVVWAEAFASQKVASKKGKQ